MCRTREREANARIRVLEFTVAAAASAVNVVPTPAIYIIISSISSIITVDYRIPNSRRGVRSIGYRTHRMKIIIKYKKLGLKQKLFTSETAHHRHRHPCIYDVHIISTYLYNITVYLYIRTYM